MNNLREYKVAKGVRMDFFLISGISREQRASVHLPGSLASTLPRGDHRISLRIHKTQPHRPTTRICHREPVTYRAFGARSKNGQSDRLKSCHLPTSCGE